jgi:hypothetical protein
MRRTTKAGTRALAEMPVFDDRRAEFAVPGIPGLHMQPFSTSEARGGLLFSACMFLFPKRALGPLGGDYAVMVARYLGGLRLSAEGMRSYPDWRYRLYVDRSVCGAGWTDPDVQALAGKMARTIEALAAEFPRQFEVTCVRFEGDGYVDGETFLPAVWRFLPFADPACEAFACWDADNPPHPLYVQRIERWLCESGGRRAGGDNSLLFFPMENHRTAWCALYVSTHLRERPEDVLQHAQCPIAQMWAARRVQGVPLFGTKILADMLDLARGGGDHAAAIRAFFASNPSFRMPRPREQQRGGDGGGGEAIDALIATGRRAAAAQDAVAPAGWCRAVKDDDDVAAMAGAMLVTAEGRARGIAKALGPLGPRLAALMDAVYGRNPERAMQTLEGVVLRSDYGVDEWVQHAALCAVQHRGVEIVARSSPQAGVFSEFKWGEHVKVPWRDAYGDHHVAALDPVLGRAVLHLASKVAGSPGNVHHAGRTEVNFIEVLWRSGAVLALTRPPSAGGTSPEVAAAYGSVRDAYAYRILDMVAGADDNDLAVLASILGESCDAAYARLAASLGTWRVPDRKKLDAWVRRQGGDGYDGTRFRYRGSLDAFAAVLDVAVRALMLDTFEPHKYIVMPAAHRPWWWWNGDACDKK